MSGYRVIGPNREVYLQAAAGEAEPLPLVTEVQLPVQKNPTRFFVSKDQESDTMQPKIVEKPAFTVVGMGYQGKNENDEIGELWAHFNPRMSEIQDVIDGAFGVCEPAKEDGTFRYLAGMGVSKTDQIPQGMQVWEVPAQRYAVFPCTLQNIHETYRYAFETWLPGSDYTYSGTPDFEYYDETFEPEDEGSTLYIYVPVKK
jgi:predicted transcriptional regulator YdeE